MRSSWKHVFGIAPLAFAFALAVAATGCDSGDQQAEESKPPAESGSATDQGPGPPDGGNPDPPVPGSTKSAPYGMEDVEPTSPNRPGPKNTEDTRKEQPEGQKTTPSNGGATKETR